MEPRPAGSGCQPLGREVAVTRTRPVAVPQHPSASFTAITRAVLPRVTFTLATPVDTVARTSRRSSSCRLYTPSPLMASISSPTFSPALANAFFSSSLVTTMSSFSSFASSPSSAAE